MQRVHQRHGRPGQQRVQQVERRRQEHEAELDGLGDAGQETGQGQRQEHAAHGLASFGAGGAVHGQASRRQAEHHHREEAAHERTGGRVAGEEAVQVAGGAVEIADDEPGDVVQDVVQAGDDEQPVQHAVDEQSERTGGHHQAAEAIHAGIERAPAEAERQGQD